MEKIIEVFNVHPFSEEIECKTGKIKMTNSHLSHWVRYSTTKDYVSMVLITDSNSSIQFQLEHEGQSEPLRLYIQLFFFKSLNEKETIVVDATRTLSRQTLYEIGREFETYVELKQVRRQEIHFDEVENGNELLFID